MRKAVRFILKEYCENEVLIENPVKVKPYKIGSGVNVLKVAYVVGELLSKHVR